MPHTLIIIYIFIVGACVGSFLNVCIYRLPLSKSIVSPRSSCPSCGNLIRFYDNIPILSFLVLRAKCRYCKARISARYLFVEIITGLSALATYMKFGLSLETFFYFIFIAALIVVIYIDLDHKIIPNRITYPGIPICFLAGFAIPSMTPGESMIGILAGGGSLFIVGFVYKLITHRDGMGLGDIKLLAMIGAMTGWQGVVFTIYVASATGTLVGLPLMMVKKKNMKFAIPFGPFLSLGAITYIFFGNTIAVWYFKLF